MLDLFKAVSAKRTQFFSYASMSQSASLPSGPKSIRKLGGWVWGIDNSILHDTLILKNALHKVVWTAGRRLCRRRDPGRDRYTTRVNRLPRRTTAEQSENQPALAGAALGSGLSCLFDQEM
jgi:hypothetical protein